MKMGTSWENVILSWINVCDVCSDHIDTLEDLSDRRLLGCFLPSCTKDILDDHNQKLSKFIQRQYPGVWEQIPSEFQIEDIVLVYSLLVHYYSFTDDPFMRNKMCSLSNASQIKIKRFLEYLLNKDITKYNVEMAIKSCCESPVQSLIEFYETSSKSLHKSKLKAPLQDYLNFPVDKHQMKCSTMKTRKVALTPQDAQKSFEEQFEDMEQEKKTMEAEWYEDFKRPEGKMKETSVNEVLDQHLHTDNTHQYVKMTELTEVLKCLEEKCANLTDENYRLSEKVNSLSKQLSDGKLRCETLKPNYLEVRKIPGQVAEYTLLEQDISEGSTVGNNKTDKDTSLEWDYADIFEDVYSNENLDTAFIEEFPQRKSYKLAELEGKVVELQICLYRKEHELTEKERCVLLLKENLNKSKANIDGKQREIVNLNKEIDLLRIKQREQEKIIQNMKENLLNIKNRFTSHKEGDKNREVLLNDMQKVFILETEIVNKDGTFAEKHFLIDVKDIIVCKKERKTCLQERIATKCGMCYEEKEEIDQHSANVQTIQEEQVKNQYKILFSKKELDFLQNSIHLQCDSSRKKIEENNSKLTDAERKVILLEKEITLKVEELASKEEELSKLKDIVQNICRNNIVMPRNVKDLQEELNLICKFSIELESLQKQIKDQETQLHIKTEKELILEKEITLKETMLVENGEYIAKLSKEIESVHQDNIEKQNTIQNLYEEKKLLQRTSSHIDRLKKIIDEKERSLIEKDNEIKKHMRSIYSLKKRWHERTLEIIDLREKVAGLRPWNLAEKRTTVHKHSKISLESMAHEIEILKSEKMALETKLVKTEGVVKELNTKILLDLNVKTKAIDDLVKTKTIDDLMKIYIQETEYLKKKISALQNRALDFAKTYSYLKVDYIEKIKEYQNMKK